MNIAILLATYNSEKHIYYQLESLLHQSYKNWHLYIHDDGSTDNTINIINHYKNKYHERITILKDDTTNRGAKNSFFWLLEHVTANYYMFCDHDDIWLPNKIKESIEVLTQYTFIYPQTPLCLYTDLALTDSKYNIIAQSMWKDAKIKPSVLENLFFLSAFNCVTGCTMLFNHKAKLLASNPPKEVPMHDWWIAYCTIKNKGKLIHLNKSTILYCQHEDNVVGNQKISPNYIYKKIVSLKETYITNVARLKLLKQISNYPTFNYWLAKIIYSIIRIF
ncbi:glycosyltransferase family 2 protein [Phocaeicola coprophilus]|uniref:glycosyltransferase family 2 protein n=1 Tax=Phocaeicola coprophilus TaxID=387090 RepID=UPI00255C3C8E|nr:glycosyltransferase family 2 protein [Phocaeicola coprophilus]